MGIKARPENTVGIPITIPENVESPPRCLAYSLDDETIIKKETCAEEIQQLNPRNQVSNKPAIAY